jgi:DNA-directed RNA polymerase specialized sigma24 family protein
MAGNNDDVGPSEGRGEQTAAFPSTRWSLIALVRAGEGDEAAAAARREVLGVLLTRYMPALRAHLLRRRFRPDGVDDLLQSFVAEKVLERDLLAAADAARGRFRGFLVTSLDNFAANRLRHDLAARRTPAGAKVLGIGDDPAWEPGAATAGGGGWDAFDVEWAREVLRESLRRMREECHAAGRDDLWEVLEARVVAPAMNGSEPAPYAELVRRHGYATPKHAANVLITAKRRFEQCLRSVLGEYVSDDQELDHELATLGDVLAAAAHAAPEDEADGVAVPSG